jgi:hypothetical protein
VFKLLSLQEFANNAPPGQEVANPIMNVNVPQEPLIPQNEVHVDHPGEVIENGMEMNFALEEEEDPEEDPLSFLEEGEFRPNGH